MKEKRENFMSIITTVFLPDGIVLAADSRITKTKSESKDGIIHEKEFVFSDRGQKIVLLKKIPVGIAFCGSMKVDGTMALANIRRFEETEVDVTDNVESIANKLYKYCNNNGTKYFVCGYISDTPYVYSIDDKIVRQNVNSDNKFCYGAIWRGKTEAASKLIHSAPSLDIDFPSMSLSDGIDLAKFIVDLTIQYEKFQDDIQTCGGPIDILVMECNGAFWYCHKLYKPFGKWAKIKQ